ncbi:uncharacterized protein [Rutidosis leptorrhynchoides]|uniref:uncharacterized protein n=1 Tax=Rutidosis leptorrhynchoides TaxID=125765 RepID=UPI003A991EC7
MPDMYNGFDINLGWSIRNCCKWWWRFKTETNCLWTKIIQSIHGIDGGLRAEDGRAHIPSVGIWHNIILAGNHIENLQISFKSSFTKSIGDGSSTSFWKDSWCGSDCFKNIFPRIFRLESNPDATVKDRVVVSESNVAQLVGNWVRQPTGRTLGELDEISKLLSSVNVTFSPQITWKWNLVSNGIFTVKSLARIIDAHLLENSIVGSHETLRNTLVPKKLEVFVWRALRKRLPVRVELDKRGIDLHSIRCPVCDGDIESVEHSLISCKLSVEIWSRVFKWWGFGNLANPGLNDILRGKAPQNMSSLGSKIWQAVEWVCAYTIWKNRNTAVFKNKSSCAPVILNEIQVLSYDWISGRIKGKDID